MEKQEKKRHVAAIIYHTQPCKWNNIAREVENKDSTRRDNSGSNGRNSKSWFSTLVYQFFARIVQKDGWCECSEDTKENHDRGNDPNHVPQKQHEQTDQQM